MKETKRERFERVFGVRKNKSLFAIQQVYKLRKYPGIYESHAQDYEEFEKEVLNKCSKNEKFKLGDEKKPQKQDEISLTESKFGKSCVCTAYVKKLRHPYVWYDPQKYRSLYPSGDKAEDMVEFLDEEIFYPLIEVVERNFTGIILGSKSVAKEICYDVNDNEQPDIYKNGTIECYVVGFGMNKTRLVPVEECRIKGQVWAVDVDWDASKEVKDTLPAQLLIPEDIQDDEEAISDFLSDQTGYCHKRFKIERI